MLLSKAFFQWINVPAQSKPINLEVDDVDASSFGGMVEQVSIPALSKNMGSRVGLFCTVQDNVEINTMIIPINAGLSRASPYFDRW